MTLKNKIEDLDDNFITQLENNPQKNVDLFYSIQNLVTFTKSDMLSMFNISSWIIWTMMVINKQDFLINLDSLLLKNFFYD